MSFVGDGTEHEVEIENDNEIIIKRLDAIIYLLEILTNQDIGSTKDNVGEE